MLTRLRSQAVREKGKFKKVNKKPLGFGAAINLGSNVTDNTLAASFKVKATGKTIKAKRTEVNALRLSKFRKNKKGLYIEKNTFRIDTAGEKRGLSISRFLSKKSKGLRL
jgi:hypothetical protein